MGLTITGKETPKTEINWDYRTLHLVRYMALRCCGCPGYVDKDQEISFFDMFTSAKRLFGNNTRIDGPLMSAFIDAVMEAGYRYPNLMLHSDSAGKYTKRGKVNVKDYLTGNSIGLMNELRDILRQHTEDHPALTTEAGYAAQLLNLVEKEVKDGAGVILFH